MLSCLVKQAFKKPHGHSPIIRVQYDHDLIAAEVAANQVTPAQAAVEDRPDPPIHLLIADLVVQLMDAVEVQKGHGPRYPGLHPAYLQECRPREHPETLIPAEFLHLALKVSDLGIEPEDPSYELPDHFRLLPPNKKARDRRAPKNTTCKRHSAHPTRCHLLPAPKGQRCLHLATSRGSHCIVHEEIVLRCRFTPLASVLLPWLRALAQRPSFRPIPA